MITRDPTFWFFVVGVRGVFYLRTMGFDMWGSGRMASVVWIFKASFIGVIGIVAGGCAPGVSTYLMWRASVTPPGEGPASSQPAFVDSQISKMLFGGLSIEVLSSGRVQLIDQFLVLGVVPVNERVDDNKGRADSFKIIIRIRSNGGVVGLENISGAVDVESMGKFLPERVAVIPGPCALAGMAYPAGMEGLRDILMRGRDSEYCLHMFYGVPAPSSRKRMSMLVGDVREFGASGGASSRQALRIYFEPVVYRSPGRT